MRNSLTSGHRREPRYSGLHIAIATLGVALAVAAAGANQQWLDAHFLPSFFMPRASYVLIETTVRVALAAVGISLIVFIRPLRRLALRSPRVVVSALLAAALALGASEVVLRRVHLRPIGWLVAQDEPLRRPDARLGWVLEPARVGRSAMGGRTVDYAIDASGCRVERLDRPIDPERPTMVFVGESIMFGEGLTWDESIPAQVGTMLSVQSANLAVHGYSSDQAYLRLERDLPRFRRPAAVVSLFMTALFGRNLDDDRPHVGDGLAWLPAAHASRLASLAGLLVPYRRTTTVEQGVRMTRAVLRATVDRARRRGADPLVVVPQLGPQTAMDAELRRRILDAERVPYVLVDIDAAWHVPGDRHPDARAARVIAAAIANRLRPPAVGDETPSR